MEEVHKAYEEETHEDEGQEVDFDLPLKFDEYKLDNGEVLVMESTCNELKRELVQTDEGEKLTFATPQPPRDKERHSPLSISFSEPSNHPSNPPTPKSLNPKFCQFKEPPTYPIPNSKGMVKKKVFKTKRDLFTCDVPLRP